MKYKIFCDKPGIIIDIDVQSSDGVHYSGEIICHNLDYELIQVFQKFEEIVENQEFSFIDEIENKIESYHFRLIIQDKIVHVADLQIFGMKKISFILNTTSNINKNNHTI